MIFYTFIFILMILNMIVFKKNKKYVVISTFSLLFLIAALRKSTIGIDLKGHYARNFIMFGQMNWKEIIKIVQNNNSFYDSGLIIFMRMIASICKNEQFFIMATSGITYGLIGRYIYKHSEDVVLETFLFFTTFTYFMFMNIIAQGLALAIVLFSIDYLEKKSYIKFSLLILLANFIHSSAIVCLLFIPLKMLKMSRSNIKKVGFIAIIIVILFDEILPFVLKYIYPQFAFYFDNNKIKEIDKLQLIHLIMYSCFFVISFILTFYIANKQKKSESECSNIQVDMKEKNKPIDMNFLFYMTLLSIMIRFLALRSYIFSRLGFYFYMFAFSLLASSIHRIKNEKMKTRIKLFVYLFMTIFFFGLSKSLKMSYGVMPYEFYWQ